MSYPDSVEYLYALGNELKAGAKFGLERTQVLMSALGHPEKGQRFVHVAGTNGKGSVSTMLASIFRHSGLRTGLYTSPHLVSPTERIQLNGEPISEAEFADVFDVVHRTAEQLVEGGAIDAHPSYFETVTAMAVLHFRDRCDVSVMEVGLGGRLDATNVIVPELCVITPVSFDHEAFLGNTLSSIASEKAGILKPGVPAVFARQFPEAQQVLLKRAEELGCAVISAESKIPEAVRSTRYESEFVLDGMRYICPLAGKHQVDNAIVAILAAQRAGIPPEAIRAEAIRAEAIREGLAAARWPGRLERVACSPDLILDGAHNPAGARALANYIREQWAGVPVWLIYGAMRDKAIDEVTAELFPLSQRLILTAPQFPRALRPETIAATADHPNVVLRNTVAEALATAREAPADGVVFVTGSLYLVGEARALLAAKP